MKLQFGNLPINACFRQQIIPVKNKVIPAKTLNELTIKELFCKASMGTTCIPYNIIGTLVQLKSNLKIDIKLF